MSAPIPPGLPGWVCPRRVGFLFPHDCLRLTPVGCPDCQNGQIEDPYAGQTREGYSRYDSYDGGYYTHYTSHSWSGSSGSFDSSPAYDSGTEDLAPADDFTEADGADLDSPGDDSGGDTGDDSGGDSSDGGFESDMSES